MAHRDQTTIKGSDSWGEKESEKLRVKVLIRSGVEKDTIGWRAQWRTQEGRMTSCERSRLALAYGKQPVHHSVCQPRISLYTRDAMASLAFPQSFFPPEGDDYNSPPSRCCPFCNSSCHSRRFSISDLPIIVRIVITLIHLFSRLQCRPLPHQPSFPCPRLFPPPRSPIPFPDPLLIVPIPCQSASCRLPRPQAPVLPVAFNGPAVIISTYLPLNRPVPML